MSFLTRTLFIYIYIICVYIYILSHYTVAPSPPTTVPSHLPCYHRTCHCIIPPHLQPYHRTSHPIIAPSIVPSHRTIVPSHRTIAPHIVPSYHRTVPPHRTIAPRIVPSHHRTQPSYVPNIHYTSQNAFTPILNFDNIYIYMSKCVRVCLEKRPCCNRLWWLALSNGEISGMTYTSPKRSSNKNNKSMVPMGKKINIRTRPTLLVTYIRDESLAL